MKVKGDLSMYGFNFNCPVCNSLIKIDPGDDMAKCIYSSESCGSVFNINNISVNIDINEGDQV